MFRLSKPLTLGIFLGRGLSFIMQFFTLTQADLDLHTAALKVNGQRDQCQALLFYLSQQAHDLLAVHKQASGSSGIHIEAVAVIIRGNVHLVQDHFTILNAAPSIF